MSPSWFVVDVGIELNVKSIVAINVVWAGFSIVEVGERSVVVRVSRVVSPSWFVVDLGVELNIESIVTVHVVRAGFAVVEVSEWTVVVGVS